MATFRRLKSGRWQTQVRKQGFPPRTKSFIKKEDAQRWAHDTELAMERGAFVDSKQAAATTLEALLDRYSREVTTKKRGRRAELNKIQALKRAFSGYSLTALLPRTIAEYRDRRQAVDRAASGTVRRELALLAHAFEVARKDFGLPVPVNPVRQIRMPSPGAARDRRLEGHELASLLNALSQTPQVRTLVQLAVETACRRGELLALDWSLVNLDTCVARLPITKNGSPRNVPLSSTATGLLHSLWESAGQPKHGHVFSLKPSSVSQAFVRACARASIAGLRFHDLRHEATSRLFERGFNVMEVATITGHKSLSMLQRYTHLRAEDLAKRLV